MVDSRRRWLARPLEPKNPKNGGQGLSDNTVRRRCGIAKQFFRDAVRRRMITENPFGEMKKISVQANRSRDYFVTREDAAKVLNACPDAQWRLLFALSRFGGLRCPSEHLALQWGHVDWEDGRIVVDSPKTGLRTMPMLPELRSHLEAVFDDAEPGTEHVITRYRDTNSNLRTQLCKIIRRAGLKPWPKLFQNLRASRATELAAEFPAHVAAAWMGHSTLVANKHYWQVTEGDFQRALTQGTGNLQNPVQSGAVTGPQRDVTEHGPRPITEDYEGLPNVTPIRVGDTGLEPVTSAV